MYIYFTLLSEVCLNVFCYGPLHSNIHFCESFCRKKKQINLDKYVLVIGSVTVTNIYIKILAH